MGPDLCDESHDPTTAGECGRGLPAATLLTGACSHSRLCGGGVVVMVMVVVVVEGGFWQRRRRRRWWLVLVTGCTVHAHGGTLHSGNASTRLRGPAGRYHAAPPADPWPRPRPPQEPITGPESSCAPSLWQPRTHHINLIIHTFLPGRHGTEAWMLRMLRGAGEGKVAAAERGVGGRELHLRHTSTSTTPPPLMSRPLPAHVPPLPLSCPAPRRLCPSPRHEPPPLRSARESCSSLSFRRVMSSASATLGP